MSWPSGSLIMMARPAMSVSCEDIAPVGHDLGQRGVHVRDGDGQVGEAQVVHHPSGGGMDPGVGEEHQLQDEGSVDQVDRLRSHRFGQLQQTARPFVGHVQLPPVAELEDVLVEAPGPVEVGDTDADMVERDGLPGF